MRPCSASEADGTEKLEGEAILPVIFGKRFEIAAFCCACIVDEDVEAAESFESGFHDRIRRCGVAQIAGDDSGFRGGLRSHYAKGFFVTGGKEDMGAFAHEPEGDGASD